MFSHQPITPLQRINHPVLTSNNLTLFIKRDDQIDHEISGNKWRKLKFNLLEAKRKSIKRILTFGGAYSNHIAATAAACRQYGFESIGIIRGDELDTNSNPTLKKAHQDGMKLYFISRSEYKNREKKEWVEQLASEHQALVIPEGGSNHLALEGVKELVSEIDIPFDYIISAVGTGGTLAGIIKSIRGDQKAIGIPSLKGEQYLEKLISDLLIEQKNNWELNHNYHFGGYAKYDDILINFINQFYKQTHIPLDPIYTGKMMYAIFDLAEQGKFAPNSTLVCIHTGGLQGIDGFNKMNGNPLIFNS